VLVILLIGLAAYGLMVKPVSIRSAAPMNRAV
jgi:hypothetical protein